MMKIHEMTPVFCDNVPEVKELGKLYISMNFKVAIHLCACGCGQQAVTPIRKDSWNLTNNDGKISLRPSIGNFNGENPYHAHYFITNNKVEWL